MEEVPLPTDADLHAEAAALAPPSEWQVRSWEELGETLEGRLSGLKALRAAARAEAYRLSQRSAGRCPKPGAAAAGAPASPAAAVAAVLVTMADHDAPFLLAFLRHAKFDAAAACGRLRRFAGFLRDNTWALYPERGVLEEVYGGRAGIMSLAPAPALSGERVMMLSIKRVRRFKPADMRMVNHASFWGLVSLLRDPSAQLGGVCYVEDMAELGLSQLRLIGSDENRTMWYMLQQVLPLRLQGMHIFRQPAVFLLIWAVASTFIARKVRERLRVYGHDTATLIKTVGAHAVPLDAGGTAVITTDHTLTTILQGIAATPWLNAVL